MEKNVLFFEFFGHFSHCLQILPQLKTFSKNLSVQIIVVLDTIFMPTLMFLVSYRLEKNQSKHSAYFAIREPQYLNPDISLSI